MANTLQHSLFCGNLTQIIKLEQKHLIGFVLLIPVSKMQILHVNISWFFESVPDTKCSTDHYFPLKFFKSCVFNRNYKVTLLLSEVRNYSQESSAYQHCGRSAMKHHAAPSLCRGKTAVTKTIWAFKAGICLQKSSLYCSNSSFFLAQNLTYLFKRC